MLGSITIASSVSLAVILIVTYVLLTAVYNLTFHSLSKIPGPYTWSISRLPFITSLLRGNLIRDISHFHRKYGPILRIAPNEVTFASPEAYSDIFAVRSNRPPFPKDPVWWKPQPDLPNSIIYAIDNKTHGHIRKVLAPAFALRAVKLHEPILQHYVNLLVEKLKAVVDANEEGWGVDVDVLPWINFTTFDIFGDLSFGESFECLDNERYHPWIELLFTTVKAAAFVAATRFYPLAEAVLMKCIPRSLLEKQKEHYLVIVDKVRRRLKWNHERPDAMAHVMKQQAEGKGLPIDEINSNFMVLTIGGSETIATALCGAFSYLVRDPQKLSTVTGELRREFQGLEDMALEALENLQYLNAILHEALRLCPPITWVFGRRVPVGGDTVCGVWLPEGTLVSIQAWSLNRNPSYFHLASSFKPERWLPEASTDPTSPYFYDRRDIMQPFGVGPRRCIGQHLAWAEMRLILAKLLWAFDFQAADVGTLKWEELKTFLLVEKKPVMVAIKSRHV